MNVQISFKTDANLEKVVSQLQQVKKELQIDKFYYCGLPRHIILEKGFSTDIVDTLDKELGDTIEYTLKDYKNFEDAMKNIDEVREIVSNKVDSIIVFDFGCVKGISKEVMAVGRNRVILMP